MLRLRADWGGASALKDLRAPDHDDF